MSKSRINLERLEKQALSLISSISELKFQLLEVISEVEKSNAWEETGAISCAHWLAGLADWEVGTAREHIRVARKLRTLPETKQSFKNGELSYAKVRQTTRVADPENERETLELARTTPARELPRVLANWRQQTKPEEVYAIQEAERGVTVQTSLTGSVVIKATLPPEEAAQVLNALDSFKSENLSADRSSHKQTTLRQKRADGLMSLSSGEPVGETNVVVHFRENGPELADGTLLHPETAKRMSCNAKVTPIQKRDGSPADVGRKQRLVPKKLAILVKERDLHCVFPSCQNSKYTDVHHIKHWADGGATNLENLALLCDYHHRWVHENGWPADQISKSVRSSEPERRSSIAS